MKRVSMVMLILLVGLLPAHGWEISDRVHSQQGVNVVESTGEKLDFRLKAVRYDDGNVLVTMTIPAESVLNKASYLRLEICDQKKILLWSKLATEKNADGSRSAGFQIHESLVKQAFIGISYDAGVKDNSLSCFAYRVPISEYVMPQKSQDPSSRPASSPSSERTQPIPRE